MRNIGILNLPSRGRCEFSRLFGNPGMRVRRVDPKDFAREFPDGADVIIIPGSAKTTEDLVYLRATGGETLIRRHLSGGGRLVGICGGFQMLGRNLYDPYRRQGPYSQMDGMGLLPVVTVFGPKMISTVTQAVTIDGGAAVEGQEIRSGASYVDEGVSAKSLNIVRHRRFRNKPISPEVLKAGPWREVLWNPGTEKLDGLVSKDRQIWSTYIHLIFENDGFNRLFFQDVRF